jgi:hypothetical protein
MHVEDVAARWTPNHDSHAEQCDAFGRRERRTSAYFQHPRDHRAILSLFRAACLWDDDGSMWADLTKLAELAGIELPENSSGEIDHRALGAMGAVSLWDLGDSEGT